MTIQVELDPETEARLTAQAERRGIPPEQYAGEFLRDNLPFYRRGTGILKHGDVDEMTILPLEVNDRESYYEDRW